MKLFISGLTKRCRHIVLSQHREFVPRYAVVSLRMEKCDVRLRIEILLEDVFDEIDIAMDGTNSKNGPWWQRHREGKLLEERSLNGRESTHATVRS